MNMSEAQPKTNLWNLIFENKHIINVLSIAIPIAVALLIGIQAKINLGSWTKVLPHVIGAINTLTAICLLMSLYYIKNKNVQLHERFNTIAFWLGAAFILLYVTYHISNPSTPYGGQGSIKYAYYFLLITHIISSIGVVRLVLLSLHYAYSEQFQIHKKITKWAYPIWLYVSVTGVLVYLMISPYYNY